MSNGIAVAYLRASTEDQVTSPDAQREAIQRWATREGIEVVAVHIDQGVSGGTPIDRRPGLLAALGDVRARRAGFLVVARRDRLARDVFAAATAEKLVESAGARIVSADGAANGDGPEAALMRSILDAFAQFERSLIKMRTKAALSAKRRKGEAIGTAPYGFRREPGSKRLVPDDREVEIVFMIKKLRGEGRNLSQIARELTARGIGTRGGGRWYARTIWSVLRTESYGDMSITVQ